jgi:hypothetical protein
LGEQLEAIFGQGLGDLAGPFHLALDSRALVFVAAVLRALVAPVLLGVVHRQVGVDHDLLGHEPITVGKACSR